MKLKNITINFHTFYSMTTNEYREALIDWEYKRSDRIGERLKAIGWSSFKDSGFETYRRIFSEVNKELKPLKPVIDKTACYWKLYTKTKYGYIKTSFPVMSYNELMDFATNYDKLIKAYKLDRVKFEAYPRKYKENR